MIADLVVVYLILANKNNDYPYTFEPECWISTHWPTKCVDTDVVGLSLQWWTMDSSMPDLTIPLFSTVGILTGIVFITLGLTSIYKNITTKLNNNIIVTREELERFYQSNYILTILNSVLLLGGTLIIKLRTAIRICDENNCRNCSVTSEADWVPTTIILALFLVYAPLFPTLYMFKSTTNLLCAKLEITVLDYSRYSYEDVEKKLKSLKHMRSASQVNNTDIQIEI